MIDQENVILIRLTVEIDGTKNQLFPYISKEKNPFFSGFIGYDWIVFWIIFVEDVLLFSLIICKALESEPVLIHSTTKY